MMPIIVPTYLRDRHISVVGNNVVVNGIVVDPDAKFITKIVDKKINKWIAKFGQTYVLDITSHCNMTCKYCYYRVDNTTTNRDVDSILNEAKNSGFYNVCLMGAEPTTRDDLPSIVHQLTMEGFQIGITTNGKKLVDAEYCRNLKVAGLAYLNYSMHFTTSFKVGIKKAQVVKNLLEVDIPVCQLAFTVSTLDEISSVFDVIDVLVGLGVSPEQFVIRAGAAIGNCRKDSGLFMSDMAKVAMRRGAQKMQDGGSNLYFYELIYKNLNIHLVRWPDNDTATPYSKTGPVFGTPLGPMRSPMMQTVSKLTPAQIENERALLLDNKRVLHKVTRDFGSVTALERAETPGKIWMHCEIKRWTLSTAKACHKIWPEFLSKLQQMGYKEIYSAIPVGDTKLQKWQGRFGLRKKEQLGDVLIFRGDLNYGG